MTEHRPVALVALLATTALLTVGCGSTAASPTTRPETGEATGRHVMADGMTMADSDMDTDPHPDMNKGDMAAAAPSRAARMICGHEIREAVSRTFQLSQVPRPTRHWSQRTLTCRYLLPGGPLTLGVKDTTNARAGRAYYTSLRSKLTGARDIDGVESFGFPAFETPDGNVAFLKDGKTLRVDASKVASGSLPTDFSPAEAAYGVAAAVIGCWTE